MASQPICFKEHTAEDLSRLLGPLGMTPRLARRIQAVVMRGGEVPHALPETPRLVLENIRAATVIPKLIQVDRKISPTDGFTKYLFRGEGTESFETVRIPLMHRPGDEKYIVCVSSQVGCAMGCVFCATGRMGFRRNLETWEIVDQVMRVQEDSAYPVRGVVFMGQGEPFRNYERVIRAAQLLSEPCGLAICGKAITISTVGIVPMIRRFTRERHTYRLVISLTAAEHDQRRSLLPVEDAHPLEDLKDALVEYHAVMRRRIVLAWTMLGGINTGVEDARRLAAWAVGLPIVIDLIDVNDATGHYRPPTAEELRAFRDALSREVKMPIVRRYSGGKDIHGACGMLANVRT